MTPSRRLAEDCKTRFFSLAPDLDALVTDNPLHIGYLCGYRSILHDLAPYQQFLVATPDACLLVTGASDAGAALEVLGDPTAILRYGRFFIFGGIDIDGADDMPAALPDFPAAVAAALTRTLPEKGKVAVDLRDAKTMAVVQQSLPGWAIADAASTLRRARAVKLPGELDRLRHASRVTDQAIAAAGALITPGITELELSAEISRHIVTGGGIVRFAVVTSGERTSRVDAYATDRRIEDGDLVRIDTGAIFGGYNSDMARTFCCGDPGEAAIARYEALLMGEQTELNMIRPGTLACDVFNAAMAEVRGGALPHYERNHCGHGIGLAAHEFPNIAAAETTPLEEGMVLCLETPYYELGWGGMMVEDTVIVTAEGCERLTPSSRLLCQPSMA